MRVYKKVIVSKYTSVPISKTLDRLLVLDPCNLFPIKITNNVDNVSDENQLYLIGLFVARSK